MKYANGYGGIVKLGGKRRNPYGVRVTTGWENGKQRFKYIGYYPTRKDALYELARFNNEHYHLDSRKITFEQLYYQWLSHRKSNASKNVINQYRMAFNASKPLHKMKFYTIKGFHMEDVINNLDMKKSTLSKVKSLYTQMFKYAMEIDIVSKNYAEFVVVTGGEDATVKTVFSEEEIDRLWENHSTYGYDLENTLILLYTGMRIEEMLQMEIKNVNLEDHYMIGGLKTAAGKERTIPIHDRIYDIIKKRCEMHSKYIVEYKGKKTTYMVARKRFDDVNKALRIFHTPHECRHTFVSRMDTAGVSQIITKMIVGHKQDDLTSQVYTHKKVDELLAGINKIK